jgi:hypothetical protein
LWISIVDWAVEVDAIVILADIGEIIPSIADDDIS